ncbi:hypothetical protein Patl1_23163 [Pistacia atlantica]|uniref:Uncharacterized protein n=1 Tax=Pistacia atlantica TaxID=434234 RepID=A0ACC1A0F7_9ROSI|nr:hypothetical protein Patl1_23163 [Pistacia atlantica]
MILVKWVLGFLRIELRAPEILLFAVECSTHLGGKSKLNNVVDPFQDWRQLGNKNNSFVKWALEMDYAVVPLNSRAEVHCLHSLKQVDLKCGIGRFSTMNASSIHLNCSIKCDHKSRSCFLWRGDLVAGRNICSLKCRGLLGSFYIDKVNEVDRDEWSSESDVLGANKKSKGKMITRKPQNSSLSSLDGPFVEIDEETNNKILHNLCISGKLTEATRLIYIMARRNQIPDFPSCINLIRGLVKVDWIDKASNVLEIMVMSGGIPDTITYNMMIGGLCRRGHIKSAISLLDEMSLSGCAPDVISYNTILRSMFDNGKFEQAIGFWKEQLRKGCPPYVITYTVLIELVCKHCGTVCAMEVLEDMTTVGCYPNIVTYNSLVNFTCRQGKYEDIAVVICNVFSHGLEPNAVTYNTLLHSLGSQKGSMEKAMGLYGQMMKNGIIPDDITHRSLIWGFCRADLVEEAVEILREMGKRGHMITNCVYKMIIHGLCRSKKLDMAIQVLELMISRQSKPDEATYSTILKSVAEAGMAKEAKKLCRKVDRTEGS